MKLPQAVVEVLRNITDPDHEPTCQVPAADRTLYATYCPYCTGARLTAVRELIRDNEPKPLVIKAPTWTVEFDGQNYDAEFFPADPEVGLSEAVWQFERQHPTMEGFQTLCLYPDRESLQGDRVTYGRVQDENGRNLGNGSVTQS